MISTESEFVEQVLPDLVRGLSGRTHVVFQTTRTVEDFKPGQVETGKGGLSIEITPGGLSGSQVAMDFLVDFLSGNFIATEVRDETSALAREMSTDLVAPDQDSEVILVKYVSLFGLDEDLRKLREICERHPELKVVAVICDCDEHKKLQALRFLEDREGAWTVVTSWCGGHGTMGQICSGIIEHWPVPDAAQDQGQAASAT